MLVIDILILLLVPIAMYVYSGMLQEKQQKSEQKDDTETVLDVEKNVRTELDVKTVVKSADSKAANEETFEDLFMSDDFSIEDLVKASSRRDK